ncbi:MAG: nuclear transport factor 2 family protein [Saprospiraceae bacterium]|nr:nuclear transport factor 2 family protein [Saprospiraceae bacterium]
MDTNNPSAGREAMFLCHSDGLLISGSFLPAYGQRTVPESETMRFQAQVSRDTAALADLLSDDLVYIHSNALIETKADFIRSVSSGGIRYLAMQAEGKPVIRQWGKTAISNGLALVSGLYQGTKFDIRLYYTAVYRKEKGIWKLCSWQSTKG